MYTATIWLVLNLSSLLCKIPQTSNFARADHVDSIYCSAATKELLLRLERYPHRLNFELGILEARKQTYKHLQKLLVGSFLTGRCPRLINLAEAHSFKDADSYRTTARQGHSNHVIRCKSLHWFSHVLFVKYSPFSHQCLTQ